jgi:sphinganine-1-phosphate aldolase
MKKNSTPVTIPAHGEHPDDIMRRIKSMKEKDIAWEKGRAWSLVYFAGEEHDKLLKAASNEMFSTNGLNPLAFKSLRKMESEVVQMTSQMLHGNTNAVGTMTSGGTESILLALFTYRQMAQKLRPLITKPEVVAPVTIHPAFDKAAALFGLQIRKAAVDPGGCAIPATLEALINGNTILIAASAPSYPNGILDPIESIANIAVRHKLPMHVDACIGGFMLPWVEKLGHSIAPWDFRVAGVTSISADVHKFGYGAKGASVLVYENMTYMRHQFMISTDFPGGIYISPTLLGTRPGGAIAAALAAMHHLGEEGYISLAEKLMQGTEKLLQGLKAIPGISIIGKPCMNIISYTTVHNKPDIFVIADEMEDRGWMIDRQQFPDCIHLTVLPTNVGYIDAYINDLKAAHAYATANRAASAKGNAAIYGMMARIPFRGMVEKSVQKIMEEMYGVSEVPANDAESPAGSTLGNNPRWMGSISRFLSAWKRWQRFFRFGKKK